MKLLEMGKDMKIKHSISSTPQPPSPTTYGGLFSQKALHEATNFLGQIYGGMFYIGTNDQIIQGGGGVSQTHYHIPSYSSNMTTVNLRIFFKVNGKEVSKVDSSSVSLSLILTWVINMYLKS